MSQRQKRPSQRPSTLPCRVLIHDIATDETVREYTIDYSERPDRRWFYKTLTWAYHNNKSVEIFNVVDDDNPPDDTQLKLL